MELRLGAVHFLVWLLAWFWLEPQSEARWLRGLVSNPNFELNSRRSGSLKPQRMSSKILSPSLINRTTGCIDPGGMSSDSERHVPDGEKRAQIIAKHGDLKREPDKPSTMERFKNFVSSLGDHIAVLNFILPPLMHWLMG
jgi:hypothetical protein